jgi:hypothetical protein
MRRLRVDGVRLDQPSTAIHGHLDIEHGGRLVVRSLMSSPGNGTLAEMHRPELVQVHHDTFIVRGIEQGSTGGAVVAEWLVDLAR